MFHYKSPSEKGANRENNEIKYFFLHDMLLQRHNLKLLKLNWVTRRFKFTTILNLNPYSEHCGQRITTHSRLVLEVSSMGDTITTRRFIF